MMTLGLGEGCASVSDPFLSYEYATNAVYGWGRNLRPACASAVYREIQILLDKYHDDGKDPNPMAKGMSWFKTNIKISADSSDNTIADLITDGCNMGVKTLHKYLNKYKAADEKSKDIAKKLINIEEELTVDMRSYL